MPRHTWTVRIELCETSDAVYAHAFLENGPVHLTGQGGADVGAITVAVQGRATAAHRSLADLSRAICAALEPLAAPAPLPERSEPRRRPWHLLDTSLVPVPAVTSL